MANTRGSRWLTSVTFAVLVCSLPVGAAVPANPDLSPEARAVLDFLESVYGKKTLAGLNGEKNLAGVETASGKAPAILGFDLSGWNSPAWGENYRSVVERTVDAAKTWAARGGIVTMQIHWIHPSNPAGSAWLRPHGSKPASPPFDFAAALQRGTPVHAELMRDLHGHADYLQQLRDARIPVLWRPLHEIEGGWFWWTDPEHPEHTAALWRLMFETFVKERGLDNLIWVYNAALRCGRGADSWDNLEQRRRFYPGDAYVDLVSIDIYPNSQLGYGPPQTDTYAKAHDLMRRLAPGKMIALAECEAIPNPELLARDGPPWLYCIPWWGVGERHSPDWAHQTYNNGHLITLDDLPVSKPAR